MDANPQRTAAADEHAVGVRAPAPTARLLLTPDEAAECLGVSTRLLYDLLRRGEVRSVKIGTLRRVPVQALHEAIDMWARG